MNANVAAIIKAAPAGYSPEQLAQDIVSAILIDQAHEAVKILLPSERGDVM